MAVTSFVIEAQEFPWGKIFVSGSQSDNSLPDPSPLPSYDRREALAEAQEAAAASVLPGDDDDDSMNTPVENNYILLGYFKIPVLKVSQNLLEGTLAKQMKFGVAHITGTAMPGKKGNCAVAGHRPYPFRYLDTLQPGDSIIIKMTSMTYTYVVYDSFEVLPNETWVLDDVWGEKYTLTVITCTPYMVSSHRLIVRARLTDINGKTPAAYYGEPEDTPSPTPSPEDISQPETPVPAQETKTPEPPSSPNATEPVKESESPASSSQNTSEPPKFSEPPSPLPSAPSTPAVSDSPHASASAVSSPSVTPETSAEAPSANPPSAVPPPSAAASAS